VEVEKCNGDGAELEVEVEKWNGAELEVEVKNVVEMEQSLKWRLKSRA
jgi:hypothetical protein